MSSLPRDVEDYVLSFVNHDLPPEFEKICNNAGVLNFLASTKRSIEGFCWYGRTYCRNSRSHVTFRDPNESGKVNVTDFGETGLEIYYKPVIVCQDGLICPKYSGSNDIVFDHAESWVYVSDVLLANRLYKKVGEASIYQGEIKEFIVELSKKLYEIPVVIWDSAGGSIPIE